jgi:hypothetical protein
VEFDGCNVDDEDEDEVDGEDDVGISGGDDMVPLDDEEDDDEDDKAGWPSCMFVREFERDIDDGACCWGSGLGDEDEVFMGAVVDTGAPDDPFGAWGRMEGDR